MDPNDDIVFRDEALPVRLTDYVATHMIMRKATRTLLGTVFKHGGYIAGGFAAILARHFVLYEDVFEPDDLTYKISAHLGCPATASVNSHPRHNASCGDIDVWFPDEASLHAFMADPLRIDMVMSGAVAQTATSAGFGIELIIPGQARVQVITKYLRPIEEQLSRFDIYNSMVAITDDRVVFPEHWATLERRRILHVSSWTSSWTVNRFLKYLDRKGYTEVTPVTADSFLDEAIKALDWFRNTRPGLPSAETADAVNKSSLLRAISRTPEKVQRRIMAIMRALPAERLLELSALFQAPARYDYAMQEIHRRMPVPCQKTPA